MRLLVFAEDTPGAIIRSLLPGLSETGEIIRVNTANPDWISGKRTIWRVTLRQREIRQMDSRFVEAVAQYSPDAVLVVKGRGLRPESIRTVRERGVPVAVYYPDNPFWHAGDTGDEVERLCEADVAVLWSERLASILRPQARRVEVLPFGYDDRWFPRTAPGGTVRHGIAFLGTGSLRRQRFLSALEGLPLLVRGLEWEGAPFPSGPPTTQEAAGDILRRSAIGVNVLHPANAGGHNMRTREIAASGALQLTDPSTDGTPLRDGVSCAWFRTPEELRERALWFLEHPVEAESIAREGQALIADDTYVNRGRMLGRLVAELVPHVAST